MIKSQISKINSKHQKKIDTTAILEQLNTHNATVAKNAQLKAQKELYEKQVEAKNQLQVQWKELDDAVLEIEQLQNDLIKDLNLSYKLKLEEGVMYVEVNENWIPLDELNTAQQLEIGVDICLS